MAQCTRKQCVPFTACLARFYFLGPLENIKRMFRDASRERGHMPYVLIQQEWNTKTLWSDLVCRLAKFTLMKPNMGTHAKWTQSKLERKTWILDGDMRHFHCGKKTSDCWTYAALVIPVLARRNSTWRPRQTPQWRTLQIARYPT